ncbi:MAG: FecCD family ABC transporter permease [Flavobacteriales bacterium]
MKNSWLIIFAVLLFALFVLELILGTVDIDLIKGFTEFNSIDGNILESRIIRASMSVLVGASCGLAGLGIQTLFKNPLAGPTTLGVNSGASLGVGVFYLIPGISAHLEWLGLGFFAVLGALAFLFLLIVVAGKSLNLTFVLIIGLLLSYASYAVLEVLLQLSDSVGIKSYVFWGMGSFNRANMYSLIALLLVSIIGFIVLKKYSTWLNIYSLGDTELKLLTRKSVTFNKRLLLIVFGVWIGLITSIVGPIAFVGIVVPNVLKIIIKSSNLNTLLPLTALLGAVMVLLADLIARGAIGGFVLPVNAVLSVLGVPIIIYFLVKRISSVRS